MHKTERVEERVALGTDFLVPSSSKSTTVKNSNRNVQEIEDDEDLESERRRDRIPSPEEASEWKRQKLLAAKNRRREEFERAKAREEIYDLDGEDEGGIPGGLALNKPKSRRMSSGKGKTKEGAVVVGDADQEDEEEDEGKELCVICLQGVRDRTVLGECGHQGFCVSETE